VKGSGRLDLALMKKRAKLALEEIARAESRPAKVKVAGSGKRMAPLGEVFAAYKEGACALGFRHRVEEHTARENVAKFRFVMRIARGMHAADGSGNRHHRADIAGMASAGWALAGHLRRVAPG